VILYNFGDVITVKLSVQNGMKYEDENNDDVILRKVRLRSLKSVYYGEIIHSIESDRVEDK